MIETPSRPAVPTIDVPTGENHDGDTFRLRSGENMRLFGVDAFELNQQGRSADGSPTALGLEARERMGRFTAARERAQVRRTGGVTYGRPVGTLAVDGQDAGSALLHDGLAVTMPRYLRGDEARLGNYMQEERLARLNRRGAFAGSFQTPEDYRHQGPKPGEYGNAQAIFFDDPTPYQGLPPEQEKGLMAIWQDFSKGPADYVAYAKSNGIEVDPDAAATQFAKRDRDQRAGGNGIPAVARPRVLTDPGDGRLGATLRGFADPINVLDEAGALVDTLLPGSERENVWSSGRRFGDIYANNVEQNRSILDHDDKEHPWSRFSGQLASGVLLPGASVEGVGFNAARAALREGASRYAAGQAARSAVISRLAGAGAIEGGIAGAGQGEGWGDRVRGAAIGAPVGGALGVGAGVLAPRIAQAVGRPYSRLTGRAGERAADDLASGAVDAGKAIGNNDAQAGRQIDLTREHLNGRARAAIRSRRGLDPEQGAYGPIFYKRSEKWPRALADMKAAGSGEVPAAINHPDLGNLDVAWGDGSFGVSRLAADDPEAAKTLPSIVAKMRVMATPDATHDGSYVLSDGVRRAIVAPEVEANTQRLIVRDVRPERSATDALESPPARMDAETEVPSIYGPDFTDGAGRNARPRDVLADAPPSERVAAAERMASGDILPLPANTVDGVEEAARIERGRYDPVRAPDETGKLTSRAISHAQTGTPINVRGPLDLSSWLRMEGGIKPASELDHLGITNAPRKGMDLTSGDRLGPLVSQDGMSHDDAAYRAWEAGFFPDRSEPPSINEFIDALDGTHSGRARVFRPDDLPEVDAFDAARRQRWDVEKAQTEGTPLTSDRGQPIGPDDLDANAPPVHAYEEWGENAPNLAGNIRLDKLDSPQAIKRALTQTEKVAGGFDAARRGRITQAETQSLANELGMTPDDLLKRRKGQAFNAEEALAARQILARSATDLVNMAKRIARTENPGDEIEAAFREAWLRHAAIQEQVSGMTAEAGRALQQFRQTADARQVGRVLPSLGDIAGGSARIKEVADQIVDLEEAGVSPGSINRFAVKALRARKRDMAMEYYINALLSGPQTHATNILSNTLTSIAQLPEHAAAAAVGVVRRGGERAASRLTGREVGSADRVMFSEVGGRFVGLLQGTREGLRDAARTLRTGDSPDAVSKVETQQFQAIPGVAGSIIRTPTRLLSAEDELFKGIARRMELTGLAIRQARTEGLRGSAARVRVGDLLENPTDQMMGKAQDYARYLTFQSPLGPVTTKIASAANSSPLLKFLIPFVRTPTNLLKFAMERSPAAPLLREWRADMRAGGARRDIAAARALVGTGIGATFYEAALDGRITGGGPADDNARRLMLADGWQPYSVRVGDRYYSYRRLDPFSTTIGTVADMVDLGSHMTERQREKSVTLVTAAILNNMASKTWLTGISGIAEALADPDRHWQDFISRTAGAIAVPALVAQVARTTDPVIREARSPIDRIRSRVPGMSAGLYPKRNVFGDPIESEGGLGPDIVSPVWTGTARNDPTVKALIDAGVTLNAPSRFRKVDGKRKDWTPAEYDRLQVAVGDMARAGLADLVKSDRWKAADDDGRQGMVRDLMGDARIAGREMIDGKGNASAARARSPRRGAMPSLPPGASLLGDAPPLPPGLTLER
jgi:endonuclease YncB( thermonuclease family)